MVKWFELSFWKRNFKFAMLHILHVVFVFVMFFCLSRLKQSQSILEGQNEALPEKTTEYFTVSGIERMDFSFLFSLEEMEHTTLLSHQPSSGLNYEVLFSSGEKDIFGENYFKRQDFSGGIVSVAWGCYLKEKGEEIEKLKKTVSQQEKTVVMLGELPHSANAAWNYSVFFTRGEIEDVDVSSVLALSSSKKRYLEVAKKALFQEISVRGGKVELCNFRQVNYQDFLGRDRMDVLLVVGVIFIMLLSESASMYVTVLRRRPLWTVQFFLGKKRMFREEMQRAFLMLLADLLLGSIVVGLCYRASVYELFERLVPSVFVVFFVGGIAIAVSLVSEKANFENRR